MTKEQEDFLASFKAGDYSVLQIMVDNVDIKRLLQVLTDAGIKLAIMPGVQEKVDFASDDGKPKNGH